MLRRTPRVCTLCLKRKYPGSFQEKEDDQDRHETVLMDGYCYEALRMRIRHVLRWLALPCTLVKLFMGYLPCFMVSLLLCVQSQNQLANMSGLYFMMDIVCTTRAAKL